MTDIQSDLPDGWVWTTLGEVQIDNSKTINPGRIPNQVFELYSVPSFDTSQPELVDGATIGSSKRVVEPETVLLCKINPRINRVWIVRDHSTYTQIASTEWIPFFVVEGVLPGFLAHYLRTEGVRRYLSLHVSGVGGSLMRVRPSEVMKYAFPLAPLNEQRRIVDAIESYFSRLDAAEAALRRAQAKLAQYKTALLKAACEGRLVPTEAELARQEGRAYEPAEVLLARVLKERRAKWEAEHPGKKYQEPIAPNIRELPELPEGWFWTTVEHILAEYPTNGRSVRTSEHGFPVLRLTAIRFGRINLKERKSGAWTSEQAKPYLVKLGDFFVSRGNGSLHLVGRSGLVEDVPDAVAYPDTMIRLRPANVLTPRYLRIVWESPYMRRQVEFSAKTTAGIHKINQQDIQKFMLGMPPLAEQDRIVAEVERRLSLVDVLETALATNLTRAARLRQAILRRAFAGQLVPQDANDEPAAVLLERIRECRGAPLRSPISRRD